MKPITQRISLLAVLPLVSIAAPAQAPVLLYTADQPTQLPYPALFIKELF